MGVGNGGEGAGRGEVSVEGRLPTGHSQGPSSAGSAGLRPPGVYLFICLLVCLPVSYSRVFAGLGARSPVCRGSV